MHPFLCYRCLHVSNSSEGLHCPHCDGDGSGIVMAANLYSAIPECGDSTSPVYYVSIEDASTQVSEEDLQPVEPTREAITQVSEEDLAPIERTREVSTQTSDDDLPFDGSHGFENCSESDGPSQNQASHDFDLYTKVTQRGLTHWNTNEDIFPNQSYNKCNAENLFEAMDDKPSSQQPYVCEQSSIDGKNENISDEFLRRQGPKEAIESGIRSDSFVLTTSITPESQCPDANFLSDSYENFENRRENDIIPLTFSFCPLKPHPMNECFRVSSMTEISFAQQTFQNSKKYSKRWCKNCGGLFLREWTFYAHLQNYCNPKKPYKCKECGAIFRRFTSLLTHRRVLWGEKPFKCPHCDYASKWSSCLQKHLEGHGKVHTGEKPFKCIQCDYATRWPHDLKRHLETHHK